MEPMGRASRLGTSPRSALDCGQRPGGYRCRNREASDCVRFHQKVRLFWGLGINPTPRFRAQGLLLAMISGGLTFVVR